MARARAIANCGDIISIASGTYDSSQTVSGVTSCSSNPIQFVASGTATFGNIDLNAGGLGLKGIKTTGEVSFGTACNGCALRNSAILTFSVWGADNVLIENNIIDAQGKDSSVEMWDEPAYDPVTNIIIRGNTFSRFYRDDIAGSHSEALYIGGLTNGILIEGNTFTDNGTTSHIFFTWWGNAAYEGGDVSTLYSRNACVRNNTFNQTHGAYFDINFREEIPYPQANIKIDPAQNASTTNPEFNASC
jgi:polygalacturonase